LREKKKEPEFNAKKPASYKDCLVVAATKKRRVNATHIIRELRYLRKGALVIQQTLRRAKTGGASEPTIRKTRGVYKNGGPCSCSNPRAYRITTMKKPAMPGWEVETTSSQGKASLKNVPNTPRRTRVKKMTRP